MRPSLSAFSGATKYIKSFKALLNQNSRRKAVITGMGVISPLGTGLETFWQNLLDGKTGVSKISHFDPSSYPTQLAAEVNDFDPSEYLTDKQIKYLAKGTQFAVASTKMALSDAKLEGIDSSRTDIIIGSGSAFPEMVDQFADGNTMPKLYDRTQVPATTMIKYFINAPASAIALYVKARGYTTTLSSACASALNAVGLASQRIEDGRADMVIAGGVDTPITHFLLSAYCSARFLTTSTDPKMALCPFDQRRTKAVLGEGSAVFILEDRNQAIARGARIYATVDDFIHQNENINELFMLESTGNAWGDTISTILKRNDIRVDAINAHGPSDRNIDKVETIALNKALDSKLKSIPITSIKGAVGSGLASAGAFQIAASAMSIYTGIIPPTYNYNYPDPELNVHSVAQKMENRDIRHVLVNGHAVGGVDTSLLMSRV